MATALKRVSVPTAAPAACAVRRRMRVLHVITGLDTGGAEMMLYKIASHMDASRFETTVVSLTDLGPMAEKIGSHNIALKAAGMPRGIVTLSGFLSLVRILREQNPDIVQTWMYHADLIGGLAARLACRAPVFWGVHTADLSPEVVKRTTFWTARLCALLGSVIPRRIVCCSQASARMHEDLGYPPQKLALIPNGFSVGDFRPDLQARRAIREEFGIPAGAPVIGMVARFDRAKAFDVFAEAAGRLSALRPDVHFVLCGGGVSWDNAELAHWFYAAGLDSGLVHLAGARTDIARVTASFDIGTLSSRTEAFPNVIGEAMACGVPCVVTDVGDCALLVGETGKVVPAGRPEALADAWRELLALITAERSALGLAARNRIIKNFSLDRITQTYEELYASAI